MLVNADTYYTQITYRTRLRKLDIISACVDRCSAEQYSSNTCKVKWMYTQREREREMDRHAGLVSSEVREVGGR